MGKSRRDHSRSVRESLAKITGDISAGHDFNWKGVYEGKGLIG
jgi:hypothetical protein